MAEIAENVKSKRYTRSRIDRMIMCAFLGITQADMTMDIPYTRVLAFNHRGRAVLKDAKKTGVYRNAGESYDHPYWELEQRCGNLYGLFAANTPEAPGCESKRRVYVQK